MASLQMFCSKALTSTARSLGFYHGIDRGETGRKKSVCYEEPVVRTDALGGGRKCRRLAFGIKHAQNVLAVGIQLQAVATVALGFQCLVVELPQRPCRSTLVTSTRGPDCPSDMPDVEDMQLTVMIACACSPSANYSRSFDREISCCYVLQRLTHHMPGCRTCEHACGQDCMDVLVHELWTHESLHEAMRVGALYQ